MKTLWTECPASFTGQFYRFEAVQCLPVPVQKPHPPIWVGGHSPSALRRVARLGDGWRPVGANPAVPLRAPELSAALGELRRLTFYQFPKAHWVHLPTTNPLESPFAALRLRTDAAKRFKRVENATAEIWKMLIVAQQRFRRLNARELMKEVYHGIATSTECEPRSEPGRLPPDFFLHTS